jgi:cytochrome c2
MTVQHPRFARTWLLALISSALLLGPAIPASAEEIADYYRQNCYNCHTIGGGRLTGPDLKNVIERKDREWLIQWIVDPTGVLNSGDPYALKLQQESKGAVMANVMGMTQSQANLLLTLIEAESKLEESNFKGLTFSEAPFTPQEIARGKSIFDGQVKLKNAGTSCMSCHSVRQQGGLGGGRLGPDLTLVYERLGGRKSLGSWLMAPATPTMQGQFKDHPLQPDEIIPLVAYLEDAAKTGGAAGITPRLNFFLLGLGAAICGLISFDFIWHNRFRAVRIPLVHGKKEQTPHGEKH